MQESYENSKLINRSGSNPEQVTEERKEDGNSAILVGDQSIENERNGNNLSADIVQQYETAQNASMQKSMKQVNYWVDVDVV